MFMVYVIIIAFVAGIMGSIVASSKNRSSVLWFILCFFLPILVLIILVLPAEKENRNEISKNEPDEMDDKIKILIKYDDNFKIAYEKLDKYGKKAKDEFKKAFSYINKPEKAGEIIEKIIYEEENKEKIEENKNNELIKKYGIVFENEKYVLGKYKYDKIEDAINYAKLFGNKYIRKPK